MKSRNICKFITETSAEKIEVHRFIYESNQEIIKAVKKVKSNRIILIKQGTGKLAVDGCLFAFEPGSLIFVFEGEEICVDSSKECEYMYMDFGGLRAQTLFGRFLISRHNRCFENFDGLLPLWYDGLYRASGENLDLVAEGILLYTFSRLTSGTDEKNTLIGKILEITEERFNDPELSVAAIAEELCYNSKYISHIFKEKMGLGYSEHLRNMRIKYAVSLLEHGIDSVKNIAILSGFSDPLYFSTVFKKTVGVSPKEYKKRT